MSELARSRMSAALRHELGLDGGQMEGDNAALPPRPAPADAGFGPQDAEATAPPLRDGVPSLDDMMSLGTRPTVTAGMLDAALEDPTIALRQEAQRRGEAALDAAMVTPAPRTPRVAQAVAGLEWLLLEFDDRISAITSGVDELRQKVQDVAELAAQLRADLDRKGQPIEGWPPPQEKS